ncbi:MAG TPA: SDR family NAD(P)-dependent oxidoreductase, partial [Pseudolabrys sp.]
MSSLKYFRQAHRAATARAIETMTRLEGRHALVTGGSRGIGRAIAAALTRAGATVTVTARQADALKATVAAGDAAHWFAADATDPQAVADGATAAAKQHGPIDI